MEFIGDNGKEIFDNRFIPLAIHHEENKLLGIELGIKRRDGTFTLTVETMDYYMKRTQETDESEIELDAVYVIAVDEISPSHLASIKDEIILGNAYDELLVQQNTDENS